MKKQKVYVDNSVIGGCFDKEFKKYSNSLIRDFKQEKFIPVISEITQAEIQDAPEQVQQKFFEIQQMTQDILKVNNEVLDLAERYIQRKILSQKYFEDALHISIATINEADILVSWNFKHIVHFEKIRFFNAVNLENGYKNIEIYSPMEVTAYGE